MHIDLSGQEALVTGGSRGIGEAIVRMLMEAGASVSFTSTTADSGNSTELRDAGAQQLVVDFLSDESTENFLATLRAFKRLDILVNNAGIARHQTLEETTLENWRATNQVDLEAPFRVSQVAAEVMKARGYGRIVNVSSILGLVGRYEKLAYTAAKHGLGGLTKGMAVELAPLGITVNAICPGLTATDMLQKSYTPELLQQFTEGVPMKRAADPREVASVITFLSSPEASYVTGQLLAIDGGSTAI